MSFKPEQHEVKARPGVMEPSRFYIIEPVLAEDGYTVQVRRVGGTKVIWRCHVSFETAADFQHYQGNAMASIIEQAKADLDQGFIK